VLALVGDEVKRDSALAKAVAKAGRSSSTTSRPGPRQQGRPAEVGRAAVPETRRPDRPRRRAGLVELVGEDAQELATEVDKLTTWAAGRRSASARSRAGPARAEAPPFDLTDRWGRRDVPGVLAASERLVERSGDAARDVLLRTAGLLTNHVGRVRECQELDGQGVRLAPRPSA
jgi:hypothetical protein